MDCNAFTANQINRVAFGKWSALADDTVGFEEYEAMTQIPKGAASETIIQEYAQQLFDAHGTAAIAEAAQKARALEEQGDREQARTWRRVENAIKELRGPHAS